MRVLFNIIAHLMDNPDNKYEQTNENTCKNNIDKSGRIKCKISFVRETNRRRETSQIVLKFIMS